MNQARQPLKIVCNHLCFFTPIPKTPLKNAPLILRVTKRRRPSIYVYSIYKMSYIQEGKSFSCTKATSAAIVGSFSIAFSRTENHAITQSECIAKQLAKLRGALCRTMSPTTPIYSIYFAAERSSSVAQTTRINSTTHFLLE